MQNSIKGIKTNWNDVLMDFKYGVINLNLRDEISKGIEIVPKKELIFNAFNFFDVENTKVIIVGQDPYLRTSQAMGLSFSVPNGIKVPASLQNIFKEINRSLNKTKIHNKDGDLTRWAEQGVLLLNKTLTLREGMSNSHKKIWKNFAKYILTFISKNTSNCVFLLWGRDAQSVSEYIIGDHLVLSCGHPSPLNRKKDFIGCNHFINCNAYLKKYGKDEIEW